MDGCYFLLNLDGGFLGVRYFLGIWKLLLFKKNYDWLFIFLRVMLWFGYFILEIRNNYF